MIYAISDVHAHTNLYYKFKEQLNINDKVYVLGDVIDKGDGSIDILLDILEDDRFTLLLGNHEWLMYVYLEGYKNSISMMRYQNSWMLNDGERTLKNLHKHLDKYNFIIEKIKNCPIQIEQTINNHQIILSHATCDNQGDIFFNGNMSDRIWNLIWGREVSIIENKITITGHTPVQYPYIGHKKTNENNILKVEDKNLNAVWYDIDCGLAMNDGKGVLGVLNLEDFSEKYFYEEE